MLTVKKAKVRVLIAPNDISGYYEKLVQGLENAGFNASFANFHGQTSSYAGEFSSWPTVKRAQSLLVRAALHKNSRTIKFKFFTFRVQLYMFLTFIYSLSRVDAYIFVYGRSFIPRNLDLILLKHFGKKVITVVGHGNEARPPYISYNGVEPGPHPIDPNLVNHMHRATIRMKRKLKRIEKYSTCVVGSSTTCQLLTKPFIDIAALRQPIELSYPVKMAKSAETRVRVLHCPSDPIVKGSFEIKKIIEEVKKTNPAIDYIELSGVSNSEILEAISSVDLVIDQLWSDSPMSMIGYEAASLGKPSITFGAALPTLQSLDKRISLPIYGYFPLEKVREIILLFSTSSSEREKLAKLQREFVVQNASLDRVAENFANIIYDRVPQNWITDPLDCHYFGGSGLSPEVSVKQMSALSARFGVESFNCENAIHFLNQ